MVGTLPTTTTAITTTITTTKTTTTPLTVTNASTTPIPTTDHTTTIKGESGFCQGKLSSHLENLTGFHNELKVGFNWFL